MEYFWTMKGGRTKKKESVTIHSAGATFQLCNLSNNPLLSLLYTVLYFAKGHLGCCRRPSGLAIWWWKYLLAHQRHREEDSWSYLWQGAVMGKPPVWTTFNLQNTRKNHSSPCNNKRHLEVAGDKQVPHEPPSSFSSWWGAHWCHYSSEKSSRRCICLKLLALSFGCLHLFSCLFESPSQPTPR